MIQKSGANGIYPCLFPPLILLKKVLSFSFTQKKTNVAKRESSEVEMKGAAAASKDSQPFLSTVNGILGVC